MDLISVPLSCMLDSRLELLEYLVIEIRLLILYVDLVLHPGLQS